MDSVVARKHRRAYFAALSYTDELIGNVMSTVDTTDLAENTVVMLWGESISTFGCEAIDFSCIILAAVVDHQPIMGGRSERTTSGASTR
jgi:hypothetical protein